METLETTMLSYWLLVNLSEAVPAYGSKRMLDSHILR